MFLLPFMTMKYSLIIRFFRKSIIVSLKKFKKFKLLNFMICKRGKHSKRGRLNPPSDPLPTTTLPCIFQLIMYYLSIFLYSDEKSKVDREKTLFVLFSFSILVSTASLFWSSQKVLTYTKKKDLP